MKKVFILLAIILITGCNMQRWCEKNHPPAQSSSRDSSTTTTTTITEEAARAKTPVPADSSGLRALLDCDSLGRVYLKKINDISYGTHVKPEVVILPGNVLYLKCKVDSFSVYSWYKRIHEKTVINTNVKEKTVVTVPVKFIPGFIKLLAWSGGIAWIMVIAYVGILLVKKYIKSSVML